MPRNLNIWDASFTNQVQMRENVVGRRRVGGGLQVLLGRSLLNARDLQLECTRVLNESLFVPMHGSEAIIWKEKERSRIKVVQMYNLRCLVGIRRVDKIPNARIRQLCGVTKVVDERIDGSAIENDGIAKKVYAGECARSHPVGRPRMRWIDTVKDCLKKKRN